MDFSKFRKRNDVRKSQPTSAMQLVKFRECWDYIRTYFDSDTDKKPHVHVQQTAIPDKLRQMMDMLVDEEARRDEEDVTGVCMEHFLKHNILHYLTTMAEKADYPVGIRGETIRFLSTMINLLDDHFLTQSSIHRPTVRLVRFSVLNDDVDQQLYHEDLVDLMYTICSKIHGYPALLHIFFHQKDTRLQQQQQQPDAEFLLFTFLLKFVHHEGRSGDYARTGLLFIIEMAALDEHPALAEFILSSSDFATNMATGLGGLYSQLPRKLVVVNGNSNNNHTDDHNNPSASSNAVSLAQDILVFHHLLIADDDGSAQVSTSPTFRKQLDAFLKLLEFCQEVLVRCPNADICKTLLHHIRTVFLQNILYPSILECTDEDGSSVAVISYIDMILEAVHQDALADMVVSFLINEDDDSGHCSPAGSVIGSNDGNVFAGLELDRMHTSSYFTAAGRFTLKNLISSRLESSSQPAVVAALKLLRTLVTKHCNYGLKIFSTLPDADRTCPSVSHHRKELELYLELLSVIETSHAHFYHGYETYLVDTEAILENDGCFNDLRGNRHHHHHHNNSTSTKVDDDCYSVMSFGSESTNGGGGGPGSGNGATKSPKIRRRRSFKKYAQRHMAEQQMQQGEEEEAQNLAFSYYDSHRPTMFKHRIQPTDRLLQILLELLSNFFAQSPELNLALTGVVSALALCPYRSLRGWIAFQDTDRASPKDVLILGKNEAKHVRPLEELEDTIYYSPSHDLAHLNATDSDDDDDLSIDYGAEKKSAAQTDPISFKSFPPFFTLIRILTQQIDYYKSDVDDFDRLLHERRRMLLWYPSIGHRHHNPYPMSINTTTTTTTTPTAASSPASSIFGAWLPFSFSSSSSSPSSTSYSATPKVASSSSPAAAAAASNGYWWSSRTSIADEMTMMIPEDTTVTADSVIAHARYTQDIRIVLPFRSKFPAANSDNHDDDNVDGSTGNVAEDMTLSMLLSNVVILEEFIKELVAIMQVRANLGIDPVRYV